MQYRKNVFIVFLKPWISKYDGALLVGWPDVLLWEECSAFWSSKTCPSFFTWNSKHFFFSLINDVLPVFFTFGGNKGSKTENLGKKYATRNTNTKKNRAAPPFPALELLRSGHPIYLFQISHREETTFRAFIHQTFNLIKSDGTEDLDLHFLGGFCGL